MNIDLDFLPGEETRTSLRGEKTHIVNLRKAKARFDKTGTAEVLLGASFGVSVKDEGDFIHVRFGSTDLTPIGSFPSAARAFKTKKEAFEFVGYLQSHLIQRRPSLGNRRPNGNSLPSVNAHAQGGRLDNLECD